MHNGELPGSGPTVVHILHILDQRCASFPLFITNDRMAEGMHHLAQHDLLYGDLPRVTLWLSNLSVLSTRESGVTMRGDLPPALTPLGTLGHREALTQGNLRTRAQAVLRTHRCPAVQPSCGDHAG